MIIVSIFIILILMQAGMGLSGQIKIRREIAATKANIQKGIIDVRHDSKWESDFERRVWRLQRSKEANVDKMEMIQSVFFDAQLTMTWKV